MKFAKLIGKILCMRKINLRLEVTEEKVCGDVKADKQPNAPKMPIIIPPVLKLKQQQHLSFIAIANDFNIKK